MSSIVATHVIKLTCVTNREDEDTLTLAECGFQTGDQVNAEISPTTGRVFIAAKQDIEVFGIRAGDTCEVNEGEFKIVFDLPF